jgi:hypothetical protein
MDRMLAFWRRVPPSALFTAVPLGILVKRALFPRMGIVAMLLRWGPIVFGAARLIGFAARAGTASKPMAERPIPRRRLEAC